MKAARVVLDPRQFGVATLEATVRRGGEEPFRLAVEGRNRLEMRWGMWRTGGVEPSGFVAGVDIRNMFNGVQYTRFLREESRVDAAFESVSAENGVTIGSERVSLPASPPSWPARSGCAGIP